MMSRDEFEKLSPYEQYKTLLANMPTSEAFDWMDDCRPLWRKLEDMKERYV